MFRTSPVSFLIDILRNSVIRTLRINPTNYVQLNWLKITQNNKFVSSNNFSGPASIFIQNKLWNE